MADFFVIEGKISAFHAAAESADLLAKIEHGLAAGDANGMSKALSNDARRIFSDGEYTHNFAAIVDGKVVCGVFDLANRIGNGDRVKLVVERKGAVLEVHSLLRTDDDLLLIPLLAFCGEKAFFRRCMKNAWYLTLLTWLIIAGIFFYFQHLGGISPVKMWGVFGALCSICAALSFLYAYQTYQEMRHYSHYAAAIFTAYGFPRPEDLNINHGITLYRTDYLSFGGINCKKALAYHASKFKLPSSTA